MSAAIIGSLRVVLGLDSAEFSNGINRASKATQQFSSASKSMEGAAGGLQTALRGLGAAIGAISIATAGQSGYIHPHGANDNGARSLHFDLRGAVMTQDLLNQMNAIGEVSAAKGAVGGSQGTQAAVERRARRRLA